MDSSIKNLPPGDPTLIENIVNQLKSQGIFDEFRRDCLADVDTKPAYQNLQHRVETYADDYLAATQWRPDLNKNQMRDVLRKKINDSGLLTKGVDRIIDQIVNPKIIQIILPKITEIVHKLLGIETGPSPNSDSPGMSGDNSHSSDSHKSIVSDFNASINPDASTESKTSSEDQVANGGHFSRVTNLMDKSPSYGDKNGENSVDLSLIGAVGVPIKIESEKETEHVVSDSAAPMKEQGLPNQENEPMKDKGSKEDVQPPITIKPTDSDKDKTEHSGKPGIDDGKAKVKVLKKGDVKSDSKAKPINVEKSKSGEGKDKMEKTVRKESSPVKGKTVDGKSSKAEDDKASNSENKEKRNSAEKKGANIKPAEGFAKIRSEDRKTKSDSTARPEDNVQRTKKLSESKDKCESKCHKSFQKTKSFEDKEEHRGKSDKHKVEKGKDDSCKPRSSMEGVKVDKNKDDEHSDKVKTSSSSDVGKSKGSESSKLCDGKFKADRSKTPEAKKHEASKLHKSAEKGDKSGDGKSKHVDKNKACDGSTKPEDGKSEKSKSSDKKQSNSGNVGKGKDAEKNKVEKSSGIKFPKSEVKPAELDVHSTKPVKTGSQGKPSPSSRDEKPKARKDSEREHMKLKTDEKLSSHSDRDRNKDNKHDPKRCSPQIFSSRELDDEHASSIDQSSRRSSPAKDSDKSDCKKSAKRKILDAGSTSTLEDAGLDSIVTKQLRRDESAGLDACDDETSTKLQALSPVEPNSVDGISDLDSINKSPGETVQKEAKANLEGSEKLGQKDDDSLSDVTVSSVHTSDLSDFDDRITLTESEPDRTENSPNKKIFPVVVLVQESKPLQHEIRPVREAPNTSKNKKKPERPTVQEKEKEKPAIVEPAIEEPRRALRRQRKLNPRYASDDFKSIFNTGKDNRCHYSQNFDLPPEEVIRNVSHEAVEVHHNRKRQSTGQSHATEEVELPGSPISDASELSEVGRNRPSGKGKWCSPSESSDGDHSIKGPRSSTPDTITEGPEFRPRSFSKESSSSSRRSRHDSIRSSPTETTTPTSTRSESFGRRDSKTDHRQDLSANIRRPYRFENQRYDSTDLYKPRPVFSINRRRGASPTKPTVSPRSSTGACGKEPTKSDADRSPRTRHHEAQISRGRLRKQSTETQPVTRGSKRSAEQIQSTTSKRRR